MNERMTCGRCGAEGRDADVRSTIANLAREARQDGHPHTGPSFEVAHRCRACRERNRQAPSKRNPEA